MDINNNVRIKTEVEKTDERVATVLDSGNVIKTTLEQTTHGSAQIEDIATLAELVERKGILQSSKGKIYKFEKILSVAGGEGAVVICKSEENTDVAVKVYLDVKNVSFERRKNIIEFTNKENAEKYVLPIYDMGFVELENGTQNYFEVQALCRDGDILSKGKYSYDEIVEIVRELNEGLHFIHENGFLHMDIKPENIYYYNGHYVFGDFGITRELKGGQSVTQITHIGKTISGTPGYQAPEVLYGTAYYKLTAETDYYSFGVTIASLYLGRFVFSLNGEYDAVQFQESAQSSHIDLENKNEKKTLLLQNLVDGLFQFDRNKRFGYDDVCKWIENPLYKGTLETSQGKPEIKWSSPFQGSSKTELLYTEKELFFWLAKNWDEAKIRIYDGGLEFHFQRNNEAFVKEEIYSLREEKYPDKDNGGDMAVFESCFLIYSETDTPLIWKGKMWTSLNALADEILTSNDLMFYKDIFEYNLISYWMEKTGVLDNEENQRELILDIEKGAKVNVLIATYWFAYIFASRQEIMFDGKIYTNCIGLIEKIISSPNDLYKDDGYLEFLLDNDKASQIFGFICSGGEERKGCAEYVLTYLKEASDTMDEQVHLLFVLFEQIGIALNREVFVDKLRDAYLEYGPYGDIKYVYSLITDTDYYLGDTKEGSDLINKIRKVPDIKKGTITSMGKELMHMKVYTDKLYENMQNNPILAQAGIYNGKKIKCKNLQGYFLYQFLGREVPLGYKDIIEAEECTYE